MQVLNDKKSKWKFLFLRDECGLRACKIVKLSRI